MPERIQLSRRAGWRKPPNTIVVARPTRWGNPHTLTDVGRRFPSLTTEQCQSFVVNEFRDLISVVSRGRRRELVLSYPNGRGGRELRHFTYPSIDEIVAALAGKNLACWCALDEPCHADVLLELANQVSSGSSSAVT